MSYEALKVWIDLLQFLWMIVATVWLFWGGRLKDLRGSAEKNAEGISGLDVRVTRLEEADSHALTHEDLKPLYRKLDEINGGLQGVVGKVEAMSAQVQMINKHLLQRDD